MFKNIIFLVTVIIILSGCTTRHLTTGWNRNSHIDTLKISRFESNLGLKIGHLAVNDEKINVFDKESKTFYLSSDSGKIWDFIDPKIPSKLKDVKYFDYDSQGRFLVLSQNSSVSTDLLISKNNGRTFKTSKIPVFNIIDETIKLNKNRIYMQKEDISYVYSLKWKDYLEKYKTKYIAMYPAIHNNTMYAAGAMDNKVNYSIIHSDDLGRKWREERVKYIPLSNISVLEDGRLFYLSATNQGLFSVIYDTEEDEYTVSNLEIKNIWGDCYSILDEGRRVVYFISGKSQVSAVEFDKKWKAVAVKDFNTSFMSEIKGIYRFGDSRIIVTTKESGLWWIK